ncbi:MAG: hypothetical protein Q9170_002001 [Blastenia crenularia]
MRIVNIIPDLGRYVQMLERQQTQLIAGVQGLHQMLQNGERLPPELLEANKIGQPLVHQILQRLGVLEAGDPWDEIDPEECKSESPSTELDSAVDTTFPPEPQHSWPGDAAAGDILSLGLSLAPSQAWSMPPKGNATPFPWTTAPSQFLNVEHSQLSESSGPSAMDFASSEMRQGPFFGPNTLEEPGLEHAYSNYLSVDSGRFSDPTINHFVPSNPILSVGCEGRGMNGQPLYTLSPTVTDHTKRPVPQLRILRGKMNVDPP